MLINMKTSSYVLFLLVPFATELVIGSPIADSVPDALEERGGWDHGGYENDHEWDKDNHGWHNKNPCEVKRSYPYYKYPCESSPSNGTSIVGATFKSFCKYEHGDSGVWYAAPKGWVKEADKPRRCPGAKNECPV